MTDALSWAPQRDVFLRRTMITALMTFLALLALGAGASLYAGWAYLWTLPTSALLTLGFMLDDVLRWRTARFDRWGIDEGCLTHDGLTGSARIPLDHIARVYTAFGGRVVVELKTGDHISLHNQRFAAQTARAIMAAKLE